MNIELADRKVVVQARGPCRRVIIQRRDGIGKEHSIAEICVVGIITGIHQELLWLVKNGLWVQWIARLDRHRLDLEANDSQLFSIGDLMGLDGEGEVIVEYDRPILLKLTNVDTFLVIIDLLTVAHDLCCAWQMIEHELISISSSNHINKVNLLFLRHDTIAGIDGILCLPNSIEVRTLMVMLLFPIVDLVETFLFTYE